MDEVKIIFYVVVGIIYLIVKARGKQQKPVETRQEEPSRPEKSITFEELLREIERAKNPAQSIPVPARPVVAEEEKRTPEPLERTDYSYRDEDQIYETYERAKQEAFARPSMEETLKLENTVVKFGQFKNYAQEEQPSLAAKYARDLRNPEDFRKAFVLSEILNRRF